MLASSPPAHLSALLQLPATADLSEQQLPLLLLEIISVPCSTLHLTVVYGRFTLTSDVLQADMTCRPQNLWAEASGLVRRHFADEQEVS